MPMFSLYNQKTLSLAPAALLTALAGTALGQSTVPFPAQFELSSLLPINGGTGAEGFVINGVTTGDKAGLPVSCAGDVNGDGIDDIIIGAYPADPNGQSFAGTSYVVFGAPGVALSGVLELSSLNGTNGFLINGIVGFDFSGWSVSAAGDVNDDGFDDVIIGGFGAAPNGSDSGVTYVVFGGASVGVGGVIELSTLNGANGFVINGINADDRSGYFVSSAGDINDDGIDDVIIGAILADPNGNSGAGESYVVFGSAAPFAATLELSSLNGLNGFVIRGINTNDESGRAVSELGDINGDGIDDLIIGASGAPSGTNTGASYVVFGSASPFGAVLELSSLNGSNGFVLTGIDAGDECGKSVSSAGDVDGDGISDLIIGAYRSDPNATSDAGESYVVFGAVGIGSSGSLALSSLNGTNGFVINGIDASDRSGWSVSSAGDMNNDGIGDLIIGASGADPNGNSVAGESYVVFGAPGIGSSGVLELSSLNGTNGFILNGIDAIDRSARSVSFAGDVNADGIGDVIIGVRDADPNGFSNAGESYVVFGRNLAPSNCLGDANGDGVVNFADITAILGNWLVDYTPGTGLGDANGDGIVNFADITTVLGNWLVICP